MKTVSFEPTGYGLGAFVHGLDLDAVDSQALREGLNQHRLVCFRGQDITDDQHRAIASGLGRMAQETGGAISMISNVLPNALGGDELTWHSDFMFAPDPYEYISLYALQLPAAGSQTRFTNAVAAARALPSRLRSAVQGLRGRAVVNLSLAGGEFEGIRYLRGRCDGVDPHFERPVLWPHPGTGEEVLAVWEQQTDALLPLPQEESVALIGELFAHLYQPAFQYVHEWAPHDLVIWDNRAVQHSRPHIGTTEPRTLRRISIGADQDLSVFRKAG